MRMKLLRRLGYLEEQLEKNPTPEEEKNINKEIRSIGDKLISPRRERRIKKALSKGQNASKEDISTLADEGFRRKDISEKLGIPIHKINKILNERSQEKKKKPKAKPKAEKKQETQENPRVKELESMVHNLHKRNTELLEEVREVTEKYEELYREFTEKEKEIELLQNDIHGLQHQICVKSDEHSREKRAHSILLSYVKTTAEVS